MRLYPERVVLGEMTDQEISLFLDMLSSGHKGVLTTFHAGGVQDLQKRLSLALKAEKSQCQGYLQGDLCCVLMKRGSPPSVEGVFPLA